MNQAWEFSKFYRQLNAHPEEGTTQSINTAGGYPTRGPRVLFLCRQTQHCREWTLVVVLFRVLVLDVRKVLEVVEVVLPVLDIGRP